MQPNERDWKLFREKLPDWQEVFMERMIEEYRRVLCCDAPASERFWTLERRIRNDKRYTGVMARDVCRSNMYLLLLNLLREGAITENDLQDFSEELRDAMKMMLSE